MSYLITMGSRPGDIVLDPFSGTGTTSIAAMLLKRDYIGIEISPEYHEIALKRLHHFRRKKAA
jgi:site-specific DNA-methyltransferase (adenine-specific)